MVYHILIVEDDVKICKLLCDYLQYHGYAVSMVHTIKECEQIIQYFQFDLIILDIMLPDDTGFNFIKRYKHILSTPVIILSAMGHVDDRVYGLEHGARDYVTKPFEPRELLLRINNLIAQGEIVNQVHFGQFTFDLSSKMLMQEGQNVHLTQSERELLHILCSKLKAVITREELVMTFKDLNVRSIDTMVARLRGKIEIEPRVPRHIITERNKGYSFWP